MIWIKTCLAMRRGTAPLKGAGDIAGIFSEPTESTQRHLEKLSLLQRKFGECDRGERI